MVALLHREFANLTGHEFLHVVQLFLQVGRMRDGHECAAGHLFSRIADDVAVPPVDPLEPAGGRFDERHPYGCLLEDGPEALLALAQRGFYLFAIRDVAPDRAAAQDLARLVAHGRDVQDHVDLRAVLAAHL